VQVLEFAQYVRSVKPPKGWSNDQKDIKNIVRKNPDGTLEPWNIRAVDESTSDTHCMYMLFASKPYKHKFVMIVFPQRFCFYYDDRRGEQEQLVPIGNKSAFEEWLSDAYESDSQ
jgi:hypothetical protein